MTVPVTWREDRPEPDGVLLIDFRAAASGTNAVDPASVDEGTLEELQRRESVARTKGHASSRDWKFLDLSLLLVIDDAADFAEHGEAYRYLLEAPTFARMLCVVVGAPAEPPNLDVPKSVATARVPVVWVGDPCGVGWRVGWANTRRLAFSSADPDGTITVANLIESLTSLEIFDQTATAIDSLPEHAGALAVLPWVHWPPTDQPTDEEIPAPEDEQDGVEAEAHADTTPDDPSPSGKRMRRWAIGVLLALTCAVVILTAALAVELRQRSIVYVAADIVLGVLMLAVLASASRMSPIVPLRPVPVQAASGLPAPPESPGDLDGSEIPVPRDVIDHANWMMGATAADESFRQLTSPEQLVMLGGSQALVRLVRFAPASMRQRLDPVDDDHVAWTTSGHQVGIIRLVPLKAGLIRPRGA